MDCDALSASSLAKVSSPVKAVDSLPAACAASTHPPGLTLASAIPAGARTRIGAAASVAAITENPLSPADLPAALGCADLSAPRPGKDSTPRRFLTSLR